MAIDNDIKLEEYLPKEKEFTHRHQSEKTGTPFKVETARKVTQEMSSRMLNVYKGFTKDELALLPNQGDKVLELYQSEIDKVSATDRENYGIPEKGYLEVSEKHAESVKEHVRSTYELNSIPHALLDVIEIYEKEFGITSSESARAMMSLLTYKHEVIYDTVQSLVAEGISQPDATRSALSNVSSSLPDSLIPAIHNAMKEKGLTFAKAHALALVSEGKLKKSNDEKREIQMYTNDKNGFIEVLHLQDRPYTENEIQQAKEMLKNNPELFASIAYFHLSFINYTESYFEKHPERAPQSLEFFNSIFIPLKDEQGAIKQLLPNAKLFKTICNNWLPSVVREMNKDGITDTASHLDSSYLARGVKNAEELSIFSSILARFEATDNPDIQSWVDTWSQICPAKNMFSNAGTELLPAIYEHFRAEK